MYDFHTHTFLSDGVLSPIELIRRAHHIGYRAMAVTDHVGPGNLEHILDVLIKDCRAATERWDILALPGVEITHVPKEDIDLLAREARAMGAKVVNVHGETVTEPVEPGTNMAAVSSSNVDILAHPGLITPDEARIASKKRRLPGGLSPKGPRLRQRSRRQDSQAGRSGHGARLRRPRAGRPPDQGVCHESGAGRRA